MLANKGFPENEGGRIMFCSEESFLQQRRPFQWKKGREEKRYWILWELLPVYCGVLWFANQTGFNR